MIIEIDSLTHPAVAVYASLTEAQLLNRLNPADAVFIAESPKVINVALDAGMQPVSLLCERRHITGDAAGIIARCPDMPVYTGDRDLLAALTGYKLTRGVLCAMRRPAPTPLRAICASARRVAVIHSVVDSTNIGAIFRSAAALGVDAVALTNTSCDPLNRRVVRVSMGSVFLVPWCRCADPLSTLKAMGFTTAAMALRDNSVDIDNPALRDASRLAIVLGNEGDGLPPPTIDSCHYVVKIPMHHNVDSLNVAAASAIAFWATRPRG